jgi:hypothetical protein
VSNGRTHHLTTVSEKDLVLVPLTSAEPLLRAFFAASRVGNGTHTAIDGIERVHLPDGMTPCYTVHWEAEDGGPYPSFDGELTVDADENFNGFWIVLTGAYIPPGGTAGQLFDLAVGNRIAKNTARGLLREIRVEIEAHYRVQTQRKAS